MLPLHGVSPQKVYTEQRSISFLVLSSKERSLHWFVVIFHTVCSLLLLFHLSVYVPHCRILYIFKNGLFISLSSIKVSMSQMYDI